MGQAPRKLAPHRSARDLFGAELRRWRTTRELSQVELGRLTHHSGDTVGKVEKADRPPSEALARRCDDVLRADGALVRLWRLVAAEMDAARAGTDGGGKRGDLVDEAASESADDAAIHCLHVGPEAVEDLHERVIALARGYSATPTMEAFVAAKHTRDAARRLRDHTHPAGQLADLHLAISQANALMASLAFDLGRFDAAGTLAQAAATYAEAAGHRSAYAWAHGLLALLANWQGDPTRALEHCQRGSEGLAPGAARYRMRHIAARSYGLRREPDALAGALTLAQADRDAAGGRVDELHDGVGGEFAFDQPRAIACAAAAWLDAGDPHRAEAHAHAALNGYRAAPATERLSSQLGGVSIDLATARLLHGDVRGAADHLHAALAVVPVDRGTAVTGRLKRIRAILAGPSWRADSTARDLVAAVDA